MPNCEFYGAPGDFEPILQFIFDELRCRVIEANSDFRLRTSRIRVRRGGRKEHGTRSFLEGLDVVLPRALAGGRIGSSAHSPH